MKKIIPFFLEYSYQHLVKGQTEHFFLDAKNKLTGNKKIQFNQFLFH